MREDQLATGHRRRRNRDVQQRLYHPTSYESRRGETYYILLAGTAADFCSDLNAKYKSDATGWPF